MEIPGPMPPLIREMLENPEIFEESLPPPAIQAIKRERDEDSEVPEEEEDEEDECAEEERERGGHSEDDEEWSILQGDVGEKKKNTTGRAH
ncbi:retinoic acid receptor gamma-like isoform X1 [Tachysurus ichikawai]